jgi:hypothetical protein
MTEVNGMTRPSAMLLPTDQNLPDFGFGSFADKNTATHLCPVSGVKRTKSGEKRTSQN